MSYTANIAFHWGGSSYAAGDAVDTTGWTQHGIQHAVDRGLIAWASSGGSVPDAFVAYLTPGYWNVDAPQFGFDAGLLAADPFYGTRAVFTLPLASGNTVGFEVDQTVGTGATEIGAPGGSSLSIQRISDAAGALVTVAGSNISVSGATPVNSPAVFDAATAALGDGVTVAGNGSGLVVATHGLYLVEIAIG